MNNIWSGKFHSFTQFNVILSQPLLLSQKNERIFPHSKTKKTAMKQDKTNAHNPKKDLRESIMKQHLKTHDNTLRISFSTP